jgi:hypothetical protein
MVESPTRHTLLGPLTVSLGAFRRRIDPSRGRITTLFMYNAGRPPRESRPSRRESAQALRATDLARLTWRNHFPYMPAAASPREGRRSCL